MTHSWLLPVAAVMGAGVCDIVTPSVALVAIAAILLVVTLHAAASAATTSTTSHLQQLLPVHHSPSQPLAHHAAQRKFVPHSADRHSSTALASAVRQQQQQQRRHLPRGLRSATIDPTDSAPPAPAAAAAPNTPPVLLEVPVADEAVTKILAECEKPARDTSAIAALCKSASNAAAAAGCAPARDVVKTKGAWQLYYATSEGAVEALGTPSSSQGFGTRVEAVFVSMLGGAKEAQELAEQDSKFWDEARIVDENKMSEEERVKQRELDGIVPPKGTRIAIVGLKSAADYNGRQGVVKTGKIDKNGKIMVQLEEDLFFPAMTATIYPKNCEPLFQASPNDFFEAGTSSTGSFAGDVAQSTARAARKARDGQVVLETAEILRRLGPLPNICNTLSGTVEAMSDTEIQLGYVSMLGEFQQELKMKKERIVSGKVGYVNSDAFIMFLDGIKDDPNAILVFKRERDMLTRFKELNVNLDGKFPFLL